MGKLVNGKWEKEPVNPENQDGKYHRQEQSLRGDIDDFNPETDLGRFHLYVSYACPWAHRTLIMRQLKKLEPYIDVSVVHPHMLEDGWSFDNSFEGATGDKLHSKSFLREIYTHYKSDFTGKVTVPILVDTKKNVIVNNESSEIIRIFNRISTESQLDIIDYYPQASREEVDEINHLVYENINNGVYKTGFARAQNVYEENFANLFNALNKIEEHLEENNFLAASILTEADIRLYTTLIRFDAVYYVHFKCNQRKISEFPHIHNYLKNLYSIDSFKETTEFQHIKQHYYYSHDSLNPLRIVPWGPDKVL